MQIPHSRTVMPPRSVLATFARRLHSLVALMQYAARGNARFTSYRDLCPTRNCITFIKTLSVQTYNSPLHTAYQFPCLPNARVLYLRTFSHKGSDKRLPSGPIPWTSLRCRPASLLPSLLPETAKGCSAGYLGVRASCKSRPLRRTNRNHKGSCGASPFLVQRAKGREIHQYAFARRCCKH